MLDNKLRHTFLTTYRWTIFIRRADEYQYELSPIIGHDVVNPSLRECFVGFAALAAASPSYHPGPGFNAQRVSAFYRYFEDITEYKMQLFFSGVPGYQASDRISLHRIHHSGTPSQRPVIGDIPLGSETIFLGVDNVIHGAVTCVRMIKQDAKKMIAEVQWADGRALAKCWVPGLHERFVLVLPY